MSAPSGSPSPLQVAATPPADDTKMPKGHCRYILLQAGIKGQRCACVNFSLNRAIPSATCNCGHLACYHNIEAEGSADQKTELELLKKRLCQLEEQLSRGHEEVLDSVVSRLNEVEDHLEKSREEFGEQIKGAYRNVSMSWRSIEQAERRSQQHDDQLRQIYDKLRDHDERLDALHAGQLELRDADLSLEERIENLTETLEEEEEWRLSGAFPVRPPRRRSTSDTSRPNIPLGPLGAGAALSETPYHSHPHRSPAGGPLSSSSSHPGPGDGSVRGGGRSPLPQQQQQQHANPYPSPQAALTTRRPLLPASSARSTDAWTVHISLLPHAFVPMPFERNTNAYQRCLSRGLHRMVAVRGFDAASFRAAVDRAFGPLLRGRAWMPLQAKLCDGPATLQGLPMLRQLDETLLNRRGDGVFDYEFLRRHCAVVDANGVMDSLYIAMRRHTLSWHTLRHAPVFMEGLEACWEHDPLLDTDPYAGDMAVDDEARPAAGEITTAAVASLKRPLAEMSRSNSFSSSTSGVGLAGTAAAAAAAAAVADGGIEEAARVKRACPGAAAAVVAAPGPQGAIGEIRRRDGIKTA